MVHRVVRAIGWTYRLVVRHAAILLLPMFLLVCWQLSRGREFAERPQDHTSATESGISRPADLPPQATATGMTDERRVGDPVPLTALEMLHSQATTRFASATGMGLGRIGSTPTGSSGHLGAIGQPNQFGLGQFSSTGPMTLTDLLPTSSLSRPSSKSTMLIGDLRSDPSLTDDEELDIIHKQGLKDLAQLMAHTDSSKTPPVEASRKARTWELRKMELVGLLLHQQPVVYVSEKLQLAPGQTDLKRSPTRVLDSFETAALEILRKDQERVVAREDKKVRMLGAIRAEQQCMACHKVKKGELLGAFSYVIQMDRQQPATESSVRPEPKRKDTAP